MKAFLLLLEALAFTLRKTALAKRIFALGQPNCLTPFEVADFAADALFAFRLDCNPKRICAGVPTREQRHGGRELNEVFARQTLELEAAAAFEGWVRVHVWEQTSNSQRTAAHHFSFATEISAAPRAKGTFALRFPLKVWRVLPPFSNRSLFIHQNANLSFAHKNGFIELTAPPLTAATSVRATLEDVESGVRSAELVFDLANGRSPSARFAVAALICLFTLGIVAWLTCVSGVWRSAPSREGFDSPKGEPIAITQKP